MILVSKNEFKIFHYPFGSRDPNQDRMVHRLFLPPLLDFEVQELIREHLSEYYAGKRGMNIQEARFKVLSYRLRFKYQLPYHQFGRGKLAHYDHWGHYSDILEDLADCYFLKEGNQVELHIFDNMTFL